MVSHGTRFGLGAGFAIAVGVTAAWARDTPVLQKAKPVHAVLQARVAQRFSLPLAERDCALATLNPWSGDRSPPASKLSLSLIDPRTNKALRTFRAEGELGFCIEAAGTYSLELSAAVGGGFELTLDTVLSRPTPPSAAGTRAAAMSPRLRALAEQSAERAQLDKFWATIKRTGTPLIEPSDDPDSSWVTFLYRSSTARALSVSWQLWSPELENTALTRLSGTDLWWKSVRFPNSIRFSYQLAIDPPALSADNAQYTERAKDAVTQVDPNSCTRMSGDAKLDSYAQRSVVQLAAAAPERWLDAGAKVTQRGRVEQRSLRSQKLGHAHALTLYLPAGYNIDKTRSYPLLIFFDGGTYLNDVPTPRLLDAMIAAHAIVPLVALFVHDDEPSQRATELPCNPGFAAFVADELLPYARAQLRISNKAAEIGLVGSSFGGLASSFIALQYPDHFGKVLSQSGSYWWTFPAGHPQFDGNDKPGWLRRQLAKKPRVATQFYLSAGTYEGAPDAWGVLEQARQQRDSLRALGYSVAYQEFTGGHDHLAWRATIPDALIALYAPDR